VRKVSQPTSVPLHHAIAVSGSPPESSTPVVGKSDVSRPFTMAGAGPSIGSSPTPLAPNGP